MLSRRNIRIKVMQLLFSVNRDEKLNVEKLLEQYDDFIKQSFVLYLFNLYILVECARYSIKDTEKRQGKYLPTPEDLLFNAKLFENEGLQSLVKNKPLNVLFKHYEFGQRLDEDLSRKLYLEFAKVEDYKDYVYGQTGNIEDIKMLLELYKVCVKNELCSELIEDHFSNWTDDKSLIIGVMKKTIKAMPLDPDFYEEHKPPDETVKDFGRVMLADTLKRDEELLQLIEPVLKNWEADRVATIDMILLKMACSELVLFPTIPTKVTINEYVEISKMYSTDRSKDFVNGVLDKLLKVMEETGRIRKEGRGLLDE